MGVNPFNSDSISSSELAYLSDVSPRDKPWDNHRSKAETVSELYRKMEYDCYFERIQDCSKRLAFTLEDSVKEGKKFKLTAAMFCRVRHCPICQWRRALMWRARFFEALPRIISDYPTYRYLFLTLTVKNPPLSELKSTINLMNKAWRKLTQRKVFPAKGWIKSLEVTREKNGFAHPHFHIVLIVPASYFAGHSYMTQRQWTELWKASLKVNYTPIVNISAVKTKNNCSNLDEQKRLLIGLVTEILKYTIKESDLVFNAEWLMGLTQQLYKVRAIALGGIFKQRLSEADPEDLISESCETVNINKVDSRFLFDWKTEVKRYQSI